MRLATARGQFVVIGYGSVTRAVLPLILRHIAIDPGKIIVLSAEEETAETATLYGVRVITVHLTPSNYRDVLEPLLGPDDVLIYLAFGLATEALVGLCRDLGALYIDTAIEPWPDVYLNHTLPTVNRTNAASRQSLLERFKSKSGPTALVAHGANPGLVSHFVKVAILRLARDRFGCSAVPTGRADWAKLAEALGIKIIQVSEYDSQTAGVPKKHNELVNTWSPVGIIWEAWQPAEFGWGTHERTVPSDAAGFSPGGGVFLSRPGVELAARSWTPSVGPYHGFLISHVETLTIADYLSVVEGGAVRWRPSVQFVYRPCDDARASLQQAASESDNHSCRYRVLLNEITSGADELGVLLIGNPFGPFWFGSRLTAVEARCLAPSSNATTLQVAAGLLAGLVWVLENPCAGLREPEEVDHGRVLRLARRYLGKLGGVYTDWMPSGMQFTELLCSALQTSEAGIADIGGVCPH